MSRNNKRERSDGSPDPDDDPEKIKKQMITMSSSVENSVHKPIENNEVRRGALHKKQLPCTPHSSSISLHSEGGTSNTNVTNHRSISRELEYPLKSDISVNLVVDKGEYNLKLTSVPTDNKMTNHAHTAAMLLSQGELLCKLGHKLLSELGAHHESKTYTTLNL